MDVALHPARDDLALAMVAFRKLDQAGDEYNYSIRENHYNIQPIDDLYKSIEKCLQVGTLISKTEKELEPVTTLLEEELVVPEPKEIDLELQVEKEEQIKEATKVQQPTRKNTKTKKRNHYL